MIIKILNMQLHNFKGVRNLAIQFGEKTNILGENATGKTTVFDAFTWLLFGKNSDDAKDFNIKTLDALNNPIHKLEHEVSATLDVDGRHMTFRRLFKEKWVKKRGEAVTEFTGHETLFFVDDVPLSQQEYNARVDFLMNEKIAKMITSPTYFNTLKWQDRRSVLEAMAGAISNELIAGPNKDFKELLSAIGNESLIDFKKKIASKKSKLKETLEAIPTRIDEVERSKPEPQDYAALRNAVSGVEAEINGIEAAMTDKSKAYELEYEAIRKKQQELNDLKIALGRAETEILSSTSNQLAEIDGQIRKAETDLRNEKTYLESNAKQILNNEANIARLTEDNAKLRERWVEENSKTFVMDDHALNCPTCKQLLPEDEQGNIKERLTSNFNNGKAAKLKVIDETGASNKAAIQDLQDKNKKFIEANAQVEKQIVILEKKVSDLTKSRAEVEAAPVQPSKMVEQLKQQIADFVVPESPQIDTAELQSKRQNLQVDLSDLQKRLATEEQINKLNLRIEELQDQERKQSQELADLERQEFVLAQFSKSKIETIENRINGKFKVVKFKMFEQQINGGETEACECMVNGVPYSDVNTAGKIQAGIDIINALTEHYNINAPVFIDNRESIVSIPECKSQIINLIVKKDAKLTVEVEQGFAMASN